MLIVFGIFALLIGLYLVTQVRGGNINGRRAIVIFVLLILSVAFTEFGLTVRNGVAAIAGVLLLVSFLVLLIATIAQKAIRKAKLR